MKIFDNFVLKDGEIVDNGWIKWFHWGVPDKEGPEREAIRKTLAALGHCMKCTSLSGCYFVKLKLPENISVYDGLHLYCDCLKFNIQNPTKEIVADCSIDKFVKYIFAEKYKDNGKKQLFEQLGFSVDDSLFLKYTYEQQAKEKYANGDYVIKKLDEYGQNIDIIINVDSSIKQGISFVSGWKVHPLGKITCNTPLGDR